MTLRIKNWSKHQHFKDRTPPWIKLYREILDDPDWHDLEGDAAKVLVNLWLVASEDETRKGRLPDTRRLVFRLRMKESQLNQALTKLGHWLIQDDISVISDRYQDDAPEGEAETEGETEGEAEGEAEAGLPCPRPARQKPSTPDCPHEEIIHLWAEKLPEAIQPRTWTGQRADDLKRRWREDPKRQNLDWWAGLFEHIGQSDFLMGRVEGKRGTSFVVSLDWLIKPSNFAKVLDGHYDRKEPAKPSLFSGGI